MTERCDAIRECIAIVKEWTSPESRPVIEVARDIVRSLESLEGYVDPNFGDYNIPPGGNHP